MMILDLQQYKDEVDNCKQLIREVYTKGADDAFVISNDGRDRVVKTAFLDIYIAWEEYLERSFHYYLMGGSVTKGKSPKVFFSPTDEKHVLELMSKLGNGRYFDYTAPDQVEASAKLLFENGYPIADPIRGAAQSLRDLKTMRNATAHMSLSARQSFDNLVQRILSIPHQDMDISTFLLSPMPLASGPNTTRVLEHYCTILDSVATEIATGNSVVG